MIRLKAVPGARARGRPDADVCGVGATGTPMRGPRDPEPDHPRTAEKKRRDMNCTFPSIRLLCNSVAQDPCPRSRSRPRATRNEIDTITNYHDSKCKVHMQRSKHVHVRCARSGELTSPMGSPRLAHTYSLSSRTLLKPNNGACVRARPPRPPRPAFLHRR